ncbi:hypothetical protein BH708_15740 [Brachybacterium sp. P6-10-X1]|uniref:Wadjet anti-phage system protein JetD domain-containing protein n=1 Tax=Brachybacterium sp. P6-10-X1 TaxID=1903186 RepID=UPI000971B649|nr:hypothetical protein BH708_15740 [Brachybacterium sp. P6-10-X1]
MIVCENAETVQVLLDLPGVMALSGSGYAISGLLEVSWVQAVPILYWGDLDADGFRILDRARHHHPRVRSVLMDRRTFAAHRELSVHVEPRTPVTTTQLTDAEQSLHADLATTGERLEQERIEIGFAVAALRTAVDDASA